MYSTTTNSDLIVLAHKAALSLSHSSISPLILELSARLRKLYLNRSLTCPFCSETDFDKVGLKTHLTSGYCPDFKTLSTEPTKS